MTNKKSVRPCSRSKTNKYKNLPTKSLPQNSRLNSNLSFEENQLNDDLNSSFGLDYKE